MSKIKMLALGVVTVGGLAFAGCEKRAPTTDQQGKGTVATTDPRAPSEPTATTPAPSALPVASDEKQPVAGRDMAVAGADLFWVAGDGKRAMIHDTALLTQIQQRLATDGVYTGATDGRTSPELAAAIRQFQAKKGLAETGSIDRTTADAMGLDWAKLSAPAAGGSETMGEKADRAGAAIENKAGELRGQAKQGAEKLGEKMDNAGGETEAGAKRLGTEVEAGAKDFGRQVETGADKAKEGAKDLGQDIEKGVDKADKKVEDSVK